MSTQNQWLPGLEPGANVEDETNEETWPDSPFVNAVQTAYEDLRREHPDWTGEVCLAEAFRSVGSPDCFLLPTTNSTEPSPAQRVGKLAAKVLAKATKTTGEHEEVPQTKDFFIADIVDYSFKSDLAGMDAPIFSLATKPDLKVWQWTSPDGKRSVTVRPGVDVGRATIFDKDILIYAASHLVAAINAGQAPSKTVRYTVYDFLEATGRGTDGDDYKRHKEALERLESTSLQTNIHTGRHRIIKGFGIIDSWQIVEKDPLGRAAGIEITLSDWLYNSILAREVLTISPNYFQLRKALERRIYELARKHVGKKAQWAITLTALFEKSGSRGTIKEFRRLFKNVLERNELPEFGMKADSQEGDVLITFIRRAALVTGEPGLCG